MIHKKKSQKKFIYVYERRKRKGIQRFNEKEKIQRESQSTVSVCKYISVFLDFLLLNVWISLFVSQRNRRRWSSRASAFKAFVHRTNLNSFSLAFDAFTVRARARTDDVRYCRNFGRKRFPSFFFFLSCLTSDREILSLSFDFIGTETCPRWSQNASNERSHERGED